MTVGLNSIPPSESPQSRGLERPPEDRSPDDAASRPLSDQVRSVPEAIAGPVDAAVYGDLELKLSDWRRQTFPLEEFKVRESVAQKIQKCYNERSDRLDLDLTDCGSLTSLGVILSLLQLKHLYLVGCKSLDWLNIQNMPRLESLSSLGDCKSLASLNISNLPGMGNLLVLDDCKSLTSLTIRDMRRLKSLSLDGCERLASLNIRDMPRLESLSLDRCESLASLNISNLPGMGNLLVLDDCKSLTSLTIRDMRRLKSLSLDGCERLASLNISNLPGLEYLSLDGCKSLSLLNLSDVPRLERLPRDSIELPPDSSEPPRASSMETGGAGTVAAIPVPSKLPPQVRFRTELILRSAGPSRDSSMETGGAGTVAAIPVPPQLPPQLKLRLETWINQAPLEKRQAREFVVQEIQRCYDTKSNDWILRNCREIPNFPGIFPRGLQKLRFVECSNIILDQDVLPRELKVLSFYDCKNITLRVLPQKLQDLCFDICCSIQLQRLLPANLQELYFWKCSTFTLEEGILPGALRKLWFGNCDDITLPRVWPQGLHDLYIQNSIIPRVLPKGLRRLWLIDCDDIDVIPLWPDELKQLCVHNCSGFSSDRPTNLPASCSFKTGRPDSE